MKNMEKGFVATTRNLEIFFGSHLRIASPMSRGRIIVRSERTIVRYGISILVSSMKNLPKANIQNGMKPVKTGIILIYKNIQNGMTPVKTRIILIYKNIQNGMKPVKTIILVIIIWHPMLIIYRKQSNGPSLTYFGTSFTIWIF